MHMEGSVNPASAELPPQYEYDDVNRERPPPYTQPINGAYQVIIVPQPLKDSPGYYNCPSCADRVVTKVKYVNSRKTHLLAGFICGFTSWCLICCLGLLPYYLKPFKKAEHYCPNCDTLLGTYSKI